jgi:hypothetical protein
VTRRKYYIVKRCTNMGGPKMLKNPMKKKGFLSKDHWVVQKMKGLRKT